MTEKTDPSRVAGPESSLRDGPAKYGWISITLHWAAAIAVVTLWILGQSIYASSLDDVDARRNLHVSVAASCWLLVAIRIAWRVRAGHPKLRGQSRFIRRIARTAHYAILVVMGLMLLSGPFVVWAGGSDISIFGHLAIAGPVGESGPLHDAVLFVHRNAAMVLLWLVLLHVAGALKHLMFHSDDTFARMIWPGRDTAVEAES